MSLMVGSKPPRALIPGPILQNAALQPHKAQHSIGTASAQRRWPFSLILSFSEHLWACVTVFGDSIKTEPRRWPHRPEAVNLCDHPPTPTPAALWMGWNVLSLGRSSNSNIFLTPWLPNASKHTQVLNRKCLNSSGETSKAAINVILTWACGIFQSRLTS